MNADVGMGCTMQKIINPLSNTIKDTNTIVLVTLPYIIQAEGYA